ncbi:alpha/beta hydrolase family protein [Oligoflexus tunisiensis]|uniref:alpha/beta hydrolase family protein n=1 Tax=Oligoflexus tunisiensis TaxID=708132 RepID=UPI001C40638C|nr:alpha/beta fold hydrolase [Oligoflexus tunisiensis]
MRRSVLHEDSNHPLHSVIYEPHDPKPEKAPVVLFLHGYFGADPAAYELMLRHIARKGFIVIYPGYGHPLRPQAWADNAANALNHALEFLEQGDHVRPDRKRVGFVGHSIGAILALHLAQKNAAAVQSFLPQPRVIITLDAAGITSLAWPFISIDKDRLRRLPDETWLLLVMAEESYQMRLQDPHHCQTDEIPPGKYCNAFTVNRLAYRQTPQIPDARKAAVMIPSDQEGDVELRSEHNAVQADCGFLGEPINAVDYWGYWKLTVGALAHVLLGDPDDYAFSDTRLRRAFGTWSTGRPARPIAGLDRCLQEGKCPQ